MLTLRQAAGKLAFTGSAISVRAMAQQLGLNPPISLRDLLSKAEDSPVGSWVSIGPTRIKGVGAGGRLSAVAIDRSQTIPRIYVGGVEGSPGRSGCGLWVSADGGRSWRTAADGLPSQRISAIASYGDSTTNPVYLASPDGWIFVSQDGAQTWTNLQGAPSIDLYQVTLLMSPKETDRLYLTTLAGIETSPDGGKTWNVTLGGGRGMSLVMDPGAPNILLASILGVGVYKTVNGGGSWQPIAGPPFPTTDIGNIKLAMCLDVVRTTYAAFERPTAHTVDIYTSPDQGNNWSYTSTQTFPAGEGAGRDGYMEVLGVDPKDPSIVYASGIKFFRSVDGGVKFPDIGGGHDDHHNIAFGSNGIVGPDGVVYTLNDGGIYRSDHIGDNWQFIGEGITNVEFYHIANSLTNPDLVIGGTQDNGTIKYDGSSMVWQSILGGDGGTVAIDPTNELILYGTANDDFSRSPDGGKSWANIAYGLPNKKVRPIDHFQVHPTTPTTLLASCQALYRNSQSLDRNNYMDTYLWKDILTVPFLNIVRSAVDPTVDLYYACADGGRVYAGPSGAHWQMVFTHPSNMSVNDIKVDFGDSTVVYACFAGSGTGRVYRLTRSSPAPSTMAYADITSTLPTERSVETIAVDRNTAFTIYVGTDAGVYRGSSVDGGTTWSWAPYSYGLPPANVVHLEVHPTTGMMRAATFGRSAFEVRTT